MFNPSKVIVLTNKQTPLKTPTSLRYATPVGKATVIRFVSSQAYKMFERA